jgi:hypothetical protein
MKRRKRARKWPPKGSYPHPDGGYVGPTIRHHGVRVAAHFKTEPDTKKLADAVLRLVKDLGRQDRRQRRRMKPRP